MTFEQWWSENEARLHRDFAFLKDEFRKTWHSAERSIRNVGLGDGLVTFEQWWSENEARLHRDFAFLRDELRRTWRTAELSMPTPDHRTPFHKFCDSHWGRSETERTPLQIEMCEFAACAWNEALEEAFKLHFKGFVYAEFVDLKAPIAPRFLRVTP